MSPTPSVSPRAPRVAVVGVLFVLGCGAGVGSGGTGNSGGGGGAGVGGRTGGVSGATGGSGVSTGGSASSGGAPATGGRGVAGSGGVVGTGGGAGTGGAGGRTATGGTAGGQVASGGRSAGGGNSGSGGATGASGGASGACVSSNCGTHRWACWRMPNPASAGLPNTASYTDLGDGTVRDNVTCLTWQKTVSPTSYTNAAARAHCATLGAGWRVGTRIEMMSILDYAQTGAKADPTAFPATPRAFFKTGSEWVLTTKQIGAGAGRDFWWAFNFSDGIVSNARSAAIADRARCVRGGGDADLDTAPGALPVSPPNQYTVVAMGEAQDNYTGLIWQQGTSPALTNFTDGKAYCASLALNGHSWRLPTIRELSTLVDEAQVAPAINRTIFPGTKSGSGIYYWTSHNTAGSTTAAWGLNFDDGFTGSSATTAWARCVR